MCFSDVGACGIHNQWSSKKEGKKTLKENDEPCISASRKKKKSVGFSSFFVGYCFLSFSLSQSRSSISMHTSIKVFDAYLGNSSLSLCFSRHFIPMQFSRPFEFFALCRTVYAVGRLNVKNVVVLSCGPLASLLSTLPQQKFRFSFLTLTLAPSPMFTPLPRSNQQAHENSISK